MNDSLWFFSDKAILKNKTDDFVKFFLPTIIIFSILLIYPLEKNEIFLFFIFYFLDAGHIFSTFLETIVDKGQRRNKKIIYASAIALALNLAASYFLVGNFFVYVFYFTIFHNLRQGLGILQLHFKEDKISRKRLSMLYYFCTVLPVLIFHFKGIDLGTDLTYSLRPINLRPYFTPELYLNIFNYGRLIYLVFFALITIHLLRNKLSGMFTFLFFTGIYSFTFLFVENIIIGMILLVSSHGLPYFFIFEKRIKLSHSNKNIQKYSLFFVFLFFIIGAILESTQDDISYLFPKHFSNLIFSIVFFPMISHYIYDMIIWKSDNENFQILKKNMN